MNDMRSYICIERTANMLKAKTKIMLMRGDESYASVHMTVKIQ